MNYTFILGAHKSGSSFLRSLLDYSIPNTVVIPIETHPFKVTGVLNGWDQSQFQENTRSWILLNNEQKDSNYGGNYGFDLFDKRTLEKILSEPLISEKKDDEILKLYFDLICQSLKSKPEIIEHIIEKSTDNHLYAKRLSVFFPNAKFIHLVRNPYSNLVSLRRYHKKIFNKSRPEKSINIISDSFVLASQNSQTIGSRYLIVRYEDLLQDPARWMRIVANHIDVNFSDLMLNPTVQGTHWGGNSTREKTIAGIGDINEGQWRSDISEFEIALVNKVLKKYVELHRYDLLDVKSHKVLIPNQNENFYDYLKNRYLLLKSRPVSF